MITLHKKQSEALDILWAKKRVFLYWTAGAGKTITSAYAIREFWIKENKCERVLIVCPPNVFHSFMGAFAKIGLDNRYFAILNTPKEKRAFETGTFKPLTLMTYDYLRLKKTIYMGKGWREDFTLPVKGVIGDFLRPSFVILDECHKIKNPKIKTGYAGAWLSRLKPKYMIAATATPISKDSRDLYNQIYALDSGSRLGRVYYNFEQRFFYDYNYSRRGDEGYYPKMIFREGMRNHFNNLIKDIIHYRNTLTEKDVHMPEKKKIVIHVHPTKEQKEIYKKLHNRAFLDFQIEKDKLKKRQITVQQFYNNALSLMSVLRQICAGFVYSKDGNRHVMRVPTNKIKALRAGIEQIPYLDKFIVWSVYLESIDIIKELFDEMKIQYAVITGGVSGKKRIHRVNFFKENPDCRALISHPRAGGAGINLQEAKYSFYFSKDYNLIDKIQSEARNYRIDSIDYHKEVLEVDIRTRDTIEEKIDRNLTGKKYLVQSFEKYLENN